MTRSWFPDGWTEDLMRMGVPTLDADFGYADDLALTPEQVEAWETNDPQSVIGHPQAVWDDADVGHTADLEGEW